MLKKSFKVTLLTSLILATVLFTQLGVEAAPAQGYLKVNMTNDSPGQQEIISPETGVDLIKLRFKAFKVNKIKVQRLTFKIVGTMPADKIYNPRLVFTNGKVIPGVVNTAKNKIIFKKNFVVKRRAKKAVLKVDVGPVNQVETLTVKIKPSRNIKAAYTFASPYKPQVRPRKLQMDEIDLIYPYNYFYNYNYYYSYFKTKFLSALYPNAGQDDAYKVQLPTRSDVMNWLTG